MQFVRRDKSRSRENLSRCPVYRIYAENIRYVICISLLHTGSQRKIKSFISSANSRGISQTRSDRWESEERAKVTIAVKSSDEAQYWEYVQKGRWRIMKSQTSRDCGDKANLAKHKFRLVRTLKRTNREVFRTASGRAWPHLFAQWTLWFGTFIFPNTPQTACRTCPHVSIETHPLYRPLSLWSTKLLCALLVEDHVSAKHTSLVSLEKTELEICFQWFANHLKPFSNWRDNFTVAHQGSVTNFLPIPVLLILSLKMLTN